MKNIPEMASRIYIIDKMLYFHCHNCIQELIFSIDTMAGLQILRAQSKGKSKVAHKHHIVNGYRGHEGIFHTHFKLYF
jgi:hypothetical protein